MQTLPNNLWVDQLIEALQSLVTLNEAITRAKIKRGVKPFERKIEALVSRLFVKQGALLSKALDRLGAVIESASALFEQADLTQQTLYDLFDLHTHATNAEYAKELQQIIEDCYLAGAALAGNQLDVTLSFDLKNPRTVTFLQSYGADLVSSVNDETKEQLRAILADGIDSGASYQQIAKAIKQLFPYMSGRTTGPKHIRSRAGLIAITESAKAYSQGNFDFIKSASDTGLTFEKAWLTVGDDRVSDDCRANQNGGWIALDDAFLSGVKLVPQHPGCRCVVVYRRTP
jgi:SPP1 gp7 family putative phage head morphogenesis protein